MLLSQSMALDINGSTRAHNNSHRESFFTLSPHSVRIFFISIMHDWVSFTRIGTRIMNQYQFVFIAILVWVAVMLSVIHA